MLICLRADQERKSRSAEVRCRRTGEFGRSGPPQAGHRSADPHELLRHLLKETQIDRAQTSATAQGRKNMRRPGSWPATECAALTLSQLVPPSYLRIAAQDFPQLSKIDQR